MDNYDGGEYEEGFEEEYEEGMEEEYDGEDDGEDMEGAGAAGAGGMGVPNAAVLQQLMRSQQGGQKQQKLKALHQFVVVRNHVTELFKQRKTPLLCLGAGILVFFERGALLPAVAGALLVRCMARSRKWQRKPELASAAAAAALYDGKSTTELAPHIESVLQSDGSERSKQVLQDYQRLCRLLSSMKACAAKRREWDEQLLQEVAWYKEKTGRLPGTQAPETAPTDESAGQLRDKLVVYHALVTSTTLAPQSDALLSLAGQAAQAVAKPLRKFERVAEGSSQWMEDSNWLSQFKITEDDIWEDIENAKKRQPPPAAAAPPAAPGGLMGLNPMALLGGMRRG